MAEEQEKMRPDVLAVVLNYNGGEEVVKTIESLLSGTRVPEVIIVDNASTDGSREVLKERFPELTLLENPRNLGFAAGMNIGMAHGFDRGKQYFWLLNNDAVVLPDTLQELLAVSAQERGLLSPAIYTPVGDPWFLGGKISYPRMRAEHIFTPRPEQVYETEYLTGCALFIPRDVVKRIGFLNEEYFLYYEDTAYSIKARRASIPCLVVKRARVIHGETRADSPAKLYWLVRSGAHFFLKESPIRWKYWIKPYFFLRRAKNRFDLFFHFNQKSRIIRRAYEDAL